MDSAWMQLAYGPRGREILTPEFEHYTARYLAATTNYTKLHPKISQRALLETSGLPTNQHYYLRWPNIILLEWLTEHLPWQNFGVNSLISNQGLIGSTPLIHATRSVDFRCTFPMLATQLENDIVAHLKKLRALRGREARRERRGKLKQHTKIKKQATRLMPAVHGGNWVRFFYSPVQHIGYLGIVAQCDIRFEETLPARLPFQAEIINRYPRTLGNAERSNFLNFRVGRYGTTAIAEGSNLTYEPFIHIISEFVRMFTPEIRRLAHNTKADYVSLEMEYDPSTEPHLRVFDFDGITLSAHARATHEMNSAFALETKSKTKKEQT